MPMHDPYIDGYLDGLRDGFTAGQRATLEDLARLILDHSDSTANDVNAAVIEWVLERDRRDREEVAS